MRKDLVLIFIFVFLDILGFSAILPLIPFFGKEFGSSPFLLGFLFTANALSQLVSAPFVGALSDIYGRKPLLLVCIFATFVSFVMLALAQNIETVFLSRILDGMFGGNIALAQTYIADVTSPEERSKGMGLIGAAFGIGFIIGPAAGGFLSSYGYHVPSLLAAALALLNLIGVFFFLEESLHKAKEKTQHNTASHFPSLNVIRYLVQPQLGPLLVLRFVHGFIFTLFETGFGFHNMEVLSLSARSSSYILCYVGVVFSMVQARGIAFLGKRFSHLGDKKVIFGSFIILAASLLLWSFSSSIPFLLFSLTFLSISSGLLNTLINSAISKKVEQGKLGGTMGLSASVGSLTRVLAPVTGGWLIQNFGISAPAFFGVCLIALTLIGPMRTVLAEEREKRDS